MDGSRHTVGESTRARKVRQELRAPRAAGVAGIIFALLFGAALLMIRPPSVKSPAELAEWYSGGVRTTLVFVGMYVIPFAGIAFLWFIGVVRDRIGHREDRLFATVFLGSGLLFVSMMFTAAASATALALNIDATRWAVSANPQLIQLSQALTYAFLFVYAARAAGVFMIVTSSIAMRTRMVPKWIVWTGYLIALVLLLSISNFKYIIMLFPLWVALLSTYILIYPLAEEERDERADQAPGMPGSMQTITHVEEAPESTT